MTRDQYFIDTFSKILVNIEALKSAEVAVLDEAFRATDRERFEEFLIDEHVVSKANVLKALQIYYQVPAIDVVGLLLDHDLVTNFPKEKMLNFGFVPYVQDSDILQVIASCPTDSDLLEVIGRYANNDVVFYVGLYRDICDSVKEFYDESVATVTDEDEFTEDISEEDSI